MERQSSLLLRANVAQMVSENMYFTTARSQGFRHPEYSNRRAPVVGQRAGPHDTYPKSFWRIINHHACGLLSPISGDQIKNKVSWDTLFEATTAHGQPRPTCLFPSVTATAPSITKMMTLSHRLSDRASSFMIPEFMQHRSPVIYGGVEILPFGFIGEGISPPLRDAPSVYRVLEKSLRF